MIIVIMKENIPEYVHYLNTNLQKLTSSDEVFKVNLQV